MLRLFKVFAVLALSSCGDFTVEQPKDDQQQDERDDAGGHVASGADPAEEPAEPQADSTYTPAQNTATAAGPAIFSPVDRDWQSTVDHAPKGYRLATRAELLDLVDTGVIQAIGAAPAELWSATEESDRIAYFVDGDSGRSARMDKTMIMQAVYVADGVDPDAETVATMAAKLTAGYPCDNPTPESGDVLVVGDSISIGYFPHVAAALPDLKVVHNPCNAMNSSFTLTNIDAWLAASPRWQAVTFNNGMWDVATWALTDPALYAKNLARIADKILAKTDKAIFVLTTAVPANAKGRTDARAVALNDVAREVMAERGIEVVDLHAVSLTIPELYKGAAAQVDVHFTDAGSARLAEPIVAKLKGDQ